MAFFMLSISAGNLFTSAVNFFMQDDQGGELLQGADYYLFFTGLMLVTAMLFSWTARYYTGRQYLQGAG
jgi:POT family proton-dependent oligopeptide transporter